MPTYNILKAVLGSFNQGNIRFGSTAGRQCACNALFSVFWSNVRSVYFWTRNDLDKILIEGDRIYKSLNTHSYLSVDELPSTIDVAGYSSFVNLLELYTGEASLAPENFFLTIPFSEHLGRNSCLMFINGYTIAIFKFSSDVCYLFDSHSRDERGLSVVNGKSVCLKFENVKQLEVYIQVIYLEFQNRESVFFQIQFVDFTVTNVLKTLLASHFRQDKRQIRYVKEKQQYKDIYKTNKEKMKRKYQNEKAQREENYRNIKEKIKEKYQDKKDEIKQKYQIEKDLRKEKYQNKKDAIRKKYQQNKEHRKQDKKNRRLTNFKNHIMEGPVFICVCCNRSLYRQSVKKFSIEKYEFSVERYCNIKASYDGLFYICLTCDKQIKKNKVPCQSVSNKLKVFDFPLELRGIRRLEKVLIAKRILFKKVTIMQKGQFPKIKGAICNVPIQEDNVVNVLPHQADSNGLIIVKLKRKLEYRGHMYFEAVRPRFVLEALQYLKNNNHFYKNVEIDTSNVPDEIIYGNECAERNVVDYLKNNNEEYITLCRQTNDEEASENVDVEVDDELETTEDPLNAYRISADETTFMSHIPTEEDIDNEILNMAPGEGVTPLNILMDEHCEELAHPHLFPNGQFGYAVERDIALSPSKYFNQRLLNYTQKFASDSDYIFFVNSVVQQLRLHSQISIAMKKVSGENLTAGMFSQSFKDTVKQFIANDKAFSFMSTVKGTPAYWKKFLQEVLSMVKQLGSPSFFLTLSCADLRWNELVTIIHRLKGRNISEKEINSMTYQDRCKLLNSNPVLLARHFQYRVETFFKDILIDGPIGKTQFYAVRVEFQVRGSPHVHAFLWTKDVPTLASESKDAYIQHIDSKISAQLPAENVDSELNSLVKTFQLHRHSKTCRKYKNKNCRFSFGKFFTEKTIIAEPIPNSWDSVETQNLLHWRKNILQPVQEYINKNLDPRKQNFFDNASENFIQLPSIDKILTLLNITMDDYERALSISENEDFQIHLKRRPDSCFVNNYFPMGLSAWEANIDIQPVYNHYKAITYMCAYLSKTEDECSNAMKQAAQEAYENNDDAFTKMKSIAKAYTTKREVSVQEAVYLVLPELWLRKIFPAVVFANSNIPEKRYRVCLTEKEIKELPEDSIAIFKRNMVDRYCDRPNTTFRNAKYSILDGFCFSEFLRYYSFKGIDIQNDSQPNELPDDLIEKNHPVTNYPLIIPLMTTNEKLKCRKVPHILRYFTPNRNKNPEMYAHHLLFMFYPFRNEEQLLSENGSYIEKLNEPGVLTIVNRNKQIIEPFADIVQEAYENFLNEQRDLPFDPSGQQENADTKVDHVNYDEEDEISLTNASSAAEVSVASFLLSDDDINARIRSLNNGQRDVFNFVLQWMIDYIKNLNCKKTVVIEPFYLFITGGGGVGKSHLLTTIYHSVTKVLLYRSGEPDKKRVLVLAPTGVAAINISGTTIHSGLTIPTRGKLFPLNDKAKTLLRLNLSCVELIIIDEISMVSSRLFRDVDIRLREIFAIDKPFGGKPIILCGDLYQLPPVLGKPVYEHDVSFLQGLLSLELWKQFLLAELTEVMRQKGNDQFISLLNQVRTGTLDGYNENLLKSRFIERNDRDYPLETIHIYAENAPVAEHNISMLNRLEAQSFQIIAIDEYPTESELSNTDITWVKNAKLSETGGLAYELTLKEGARIMITKNIDIEDKLINGQVGFIKYIKLANNKVSDIYVKLDDPTAGQKSRQSDHLSCANNWVKITRTESVFNTKKRFSNSPSIRRTQFPIMLAWACTCHKVQGLSLPSAVISFQLFKQRQFNAGQIYVALSRVTNIEGLYIIGEFTDKSIRVNAKAEVEYQRQRKESIFRPRAQHNISPDSLTICLLNTRSLSKHSVDIASDMRLFTVDLLCLTETQLESNRNVEHIQISLPSFNIDFNNVSCHRFNNIAICSKDDILIGCHIKLDAISIFTLQKPTFSMEKISIAVIYKQQNLQNGVFYTTLCNILTEHNIDILMGDFNFDALNDQHNLPISIRDKYKLIVNRPTHLSGGLLDHVYIKDTFLDKITYQTLIQNIFFSDHDAVSFQLKYQKIY